MGYSIPVKKNEAGLNIRFCKDLLTYLIYQKYYYVKKVKVQKSIHIMQPFSKKERERIKETGKCGCLFNFVA